jgi:hypothetical protein
MLLKEEVGVERETLSPSRKVGECIYLLRIEDEVVHFLPSPKTPDKLPGFWRDDKNSSLHPSLLLPLSLLLSSKAVILYLIYQCPLNLHFLFKTRTNAGHNEARAVLNHR